MASNSSSHFNTTDIPVDKKRSWKKELLFLVIIAAVAVYFLGFSDIFPANYSRAAYQAKLTVVSASSTAAVATATPPAALDVAQYNQELLANANEPIAPASVGTSTASSTAIAKTPLWPVKTVLPDAGALLPSHRIVAYYGNFYSTKMGVLGEYPPDQMIPMLMSAVAQWQAADPTTPVIPGIDYIAVTAQGSPGADGMYRLRMPASQIQEAISLANQVNGVVILDVQVGLSTVETEIPLLDPYLKLPNVELALDPEFAMHNGAVPGSEIGSLDATDINWAANHLAAVVQANNLPPKVLIVHRFTQDMVTNYQDITPLPQVEIVMDMDGWGSQAKKTNTYLQVIHDEPVQFTGFKLFYKNDLKPPSTGMMTPQEVLNLSPQPLFIQYQ